MKLHEFGFDHWFESHAPEHCPDGCGFARVCAVDRGSYRLLHEAGEVPAVLSGGLHHQTARSADLPCVGDWVAARLPGEDDAAVVHRVFPRKTFLRRKTPGKTIDHQMIAANVDTAFILQSCRFDFNPARLDRYLVMAAQGHVEPIVLLTKADLVTREELDRQITSLGFTAKAEALAISTRAGAGLDALQRRLVPGKTYCLLGSSGVGKTTLINHLLGQAAFRTQAVSATGEGTHTTTRRQLVVLRQGAMLIDTPGMRELGLVDTEEGLGGGFADIAALSELCRYADCRHEHEPGCAVRAAVENGELAEDRYANAIKLRRESEFHAMSHWDKRRKDRAFGRLVKSVKKRSKT